MKISKRTGFRKEAVSRQEHESWSFCFNSLAKKINVIYMVRKMFFLFGEQTHLKLSIKQRATTERKTTTFHSLYPCYLNISPATFLMFSQ